MSRGSGRGCKLAVAAAAGSTARDPHALVCSGRRRLLDRRRKRTGTCINRIPRRARLLAVKVHAGSETTGCMLATLD